MKLWQKDIEVNKEIERFTVGNDNVLDLKLAPYDVLGSLAHITMLETIGLLTKEELVVLKKELVILYHEIEKNGIKIEDGVEDIHSQVELILTRKLGDIGKKIHSGRSRNDQVLVDLKLYTRDAIEHTVHLVENLFNRLISLSEQHKDTLLPGYTHLQIAMPSSFGLWFGAYAEGLVDDLRTLKAAYEVANKNPLGSGAGYGSSFPLNRTLTTELLGFSQMHVNVVYAQMSRGKTEYIVTSAISNLASTLSRLAMDVCLYISQNFGFISFPDELTTGSSIMPHKKNPDVFELIRGKGNKLKGIPVQIGQIIGNLPSGYHRDMQVIKGLFMDTFDEINDCLVLTDLMLANIEVKESIVQDEKYDYLFSVERVNQLVLEGVPFRDAYKQVGKEIGEGNFKPSYELKHSHEGSLGNLRNDLIQKEFELVLGSFDFDSKRLAIDRLVEKQV
jgi:argininosuccinate lyase